MSGAPRIPEEAVEAVEKAAKAMEALDDASGPCVSDPEWGKHPPPEYADLARVAVAAAFEALGMTEERREAHEAYCSPENGGEEGYRARCWSCDYVGPLYARESYPHPGIKDKAREDAAAHRSGFERRLVSAWVSVGRGSDNEKETSNER